jgi:hypothetical protein
MNKNNFNINMINKCENNNEYEKCEEFDTILKNSYCYSSSHFVNDIIFKMYNIKLPVIETISHDSHFLNITNFNDDNELEERIFVSIINCHYNKGGHIIKYLCENIDYNIPLLFVYTEYDTNISISYIENLLEIRNKKNNINLLIHNKVDIKNIYKYSRIILIPSLCDETFCRIGYEAMNNKIPIISTTNGNLKYLLDKYAIFLPDSETYYDMWKINIQNIYNNNDLLKKYSNNNNINLSYNIVKNKVINFFNNVYEKNNEISKYKLNEKNICLIIPFADQGLGIQGRDYYITLKKLGYNPFIFSFKPYHSTETDKLLQCLPSEWNTYNNIYIHLYLKLKNKNFNK